MSNDKMALQEQVSTSPPSPERITSLDGLRGLAIITVVLFHTYARWPDYIPWVTAYSNTIFEFGWLGVQLFFLISGFAIYMTLEKCDTFGDFIARRWLRLFPAMLIASILVYSTSFFLIERPNGEINPFDLLSGLLFVDARYLNGIQNFVEIKTIEGAFWTLFVEVKFYLIFGTLYFTSRNTALRNLTMIFLLSFLFKIYGHMWPQLAQALVNKTLFDFMSLQHFGWFCLGALVYKSSIVKSRSLEYATAILLIPTVLMTNSQSYKVILACVLVFVLFYSSLKVRFLSRLISAKVLVYFGFISYPLYLIHENAMVAFTIKANKWTDVLPDYMTPWPGLALIIITSFVIARYLEPMTKRKMKQYIFHPLSQLKQPPQIPT